MQHWSVMTEEALSLEAAGAAGYTLSPQQLAKQTTIGYARILRAIGGRNGPGLGIACPRLPAVHVRLAGSPPGYRIRPQEAEEWLRKVLATTTGPDRVQASARDPRRRPTAQGRHQGVQPGDGEARAGGVAPMAAAR